MLSKFFIKNNTNTTSVRELTDGETAEVSGGGSKYTYYSYSSGSDTVYTANNGGSKY